MQEHTVDPSPNGHLNRRQSWRVCLGLLGVALLFSLALVSAAALNCLVPKVPDRAQGVTARMGWYLHSGQWQADVRTLTASFHYMMATESDTPTVDDVSSLPVAANATPSSPKS